MHEYKVVFWGARGEVLATVVVLEKSTGRAKCRANELVTCSWVLMTAERVR
jgi:hypothetical protein